MISSNRIGVVRKVISKIVLIKEHIIIKTRLVKSNRFLHQIGYNKERTYQINFIVNWLLKVTVAENNVQIWP